MKTQVLQPIAAEFNFRHMFSAVLVQPDFGLDFEAPYIRTPDGCSLVVSHNLFVLKKAWRCCETTRGLVVTGLSPALRQALSLISKSVEFNIGILLFVSQNKDKKIKFFMLFF
jgi:hypothetical protein